MSDRSVPYYQQKVTHGEVDEWHDDFEGADQAIVEDEISWGIMSGLGVTEQGVPDLTVLLADGIAYDETGQRIVVTGGPKTVDLTAYVPAVGGQERYVALYVEAARVASDPRIDGDGVPLNYRSTEGYDVHIEAGVAAAPPAAKPGIVANKVLCNVVILTNGMGAITNTEISMDAPSGDRQGGGVLWRRNRANTGTAQFESGVGSIIEANGNDIDMEAGDVLKADKVEANTPDPAAGQGHVYTNPSTGALIAVEDWVSVDASGMFPGIGAAFQDPWLSPRALNNWYLGTTAGTVATENDGGGTPTKFDLGWRMEFNAGGATEDNAGLFIPLTLPHGSRIITAYLDLVADGALAANHRLKLYVMRRHHGIATVDIMNNGGAPTPFDTGGAGNKQIAEDVSASYYTVNNSLYAYYLVLMNSAGGAVANQDQYRVTNARIKLNWREASKVY